MIFSRCIKIFFNCLHKFVHEEINRPHPTVSFLVVSKSRRMLISAISVKPQKIRFLNNLDWLVFPCHTRQHKRLSSTFSCNHLREWTMLFSFKQTWANRSMTTLHEIKYAWEGGIQMPLTNSENDWSTILVSSSHVISEACCFRIIESLPFVCLKRFSLQIITSIHLKRTTRFSNAYTPLNPSTHSHQQEQEHLFKYFLALASQLLQKILSSSQSAKNTNQTWNN